MWSYFPWKWSEMDSFSSIINISYCYLFYRNILVFLWLLLWVVLLLSLRCTSDGKHNNNKSDNKSNVDIVHHNYHDNYRYYCYSCCFCSLYYCHLINIIARVLITIIFLIIISPFRILNVKIYIFLMLFHHYYNR